MIFIFNSLLLIIYLRQLINLYSYLNFVIYFFNFIFLNLLIVGIGDWGLGIGPNPQSPIPNPQSPIPNPHHKKILNNLIMEKSISIFLDFNFI